jgi:hypothetical protein
MYPYIRYTIPYNGKDVLEQLTPTQELDDLIWLLDQCGFDEQIRAMPYKDIFLRMRHEMMGKHFRPHETVECKIISSFLNVSNLPFTDSSSHNIVKHFFTSIWHSINTYSEQANLIAYKIEQIAQGSEPVPPVQNMSLPDDVTAEGQKIALLLMFTQPKSFRKDFFLWTQQQALFEHLHALNPSHSFVQEQLEKNTTSFKSLYLNANRRRIAAKRRRHQSIGPLDDFYTSLHKYSYSKKCSIIRCLLETDLAA